MSPRKHTGANRKAEAATGQSPRSTLLGWLFRKLSCHQGLHQTVTRLAESSEVHPSWNCLTKVTCRQLIKHQTPTAGPGSHAMPRCRRQENCLEPTSGSPSGSLRGAVVTRCCGTGGATELWQVRYCTTGSKGQLWGRGPRLTALQL